MQQHSVSKPNANQHTFKSSNYAQVCAHYTALLSEHYTWTFGGSAARVKLQHAMLATDLASHLSMTPSDQENTSLDQENTVLDLEYHSKALDLGCGSGFQTLPLLQLGFAVTAIDQSSHLLNELTLAANTLSINPLPLQCIQTDLLEYSAKCPAESMNVIVCMGDTATHLASITEVSSLLTNSFRILLPAGKLILQFRDLTNPLLGTDRFIPIRSDDRTVFTCFLEWDTTNCNNTEGRECKITDCNHTDGLDCKTTTCNNNTEVDVDLNATTCNNTKGDGTGCQITVHDLVHVKKGIGAWELCKSSYKKIGMTRVYACRLLVNIGFVLESVDDESGNIKIVCTKPVNPV